jgi:hypothetical protein
MRKKLKKLEIRRETLADLDGPDLLRARGGDLVPGDPTPVPEETLWCPDTKCSNCSGTKPCCLPAQP